MATLKLDMFDASDDEFKIHTCNKANGDNYIQFELENKQSSCVFDIYQKDEIEHLIAFLQHSVQKLKNY